MRPSHVRATLFCLRCAERRGRWTSEQARTCPAGLNLRVRRRQNGTPDVPRCATWRPVAQPPHPHCRNHQVGRLTRRASSAHRSCSGSPVTSIQRSPISPRPSSSISSGRGTFLLRLSLPFLRATKKWMMCCKQATRDPHAALQPNDTVASEPLPSHHSQKTPPHPYVPPLREGAACRIRRSSPTRKLVMM